MTEIFDFKDSPEFYIPRGRGKFYWKFIGAAFLLLVLLALIGWLLMLIFPGKVGPGFGTAVFWASLYPMWRYLVPSQERWNEILREEEKIHNEYAVKIWSMQGATGHLEALEKLGWAYEKGIGVDKDQKRAIDFYRRAAEKGGKLAISKLKEFDSMERLLREKSEFEDKVKFQEAAPKDAICPNCGERIARVAVKCLNCGALFADDGWNPIDGGKSAVNRVSIAVSNVDSDDQGLYSRLYNNKKSKTYIFLGGVSLGFSILIYGLYLINGKQGGGMVVFGLCSFIFSILCHLLALILYSTSIIRSGK